MPAEGAIKWSQPYSFQTQFSTSKALGYGVSQLTHLRQSKLHPKQTVKRVSTIVINCKYSVK